MQIMCSTQFKNSFYSLQKSLEIRLFACYYTLKPILHDRYNFENQSFGNRAAVVMRKIGE